MLGKPSSIILYLPNAPDLSEGSDAISIIHRNGNHWRKILSIYAKLMVDSGRWQDYRDHSLLLEHAISFSDQLIETTASESVIHWVAGKASWERLGVSPESCQPLDTEQRVWCGNSLLLTPYPDYRQFPNYLIEQVREWMSTP